MENFPEKICDLELYSQKSIAWILGTSLSRFLLQDIIQNMLFSF